MRKIMISIFLVLFFALSGCSAGLGSGKGENSADGKNESSAENIKASVSKTLEGDIKFYPTYDPDYKTASNEIFAFWFDIPNEWTAEDLSEDGSEYTIHLGKDNVEIKIYGVMKDKSEEDYYALLAGNKGEISDFLYRDGWTGKQVTVSDTERYYVRVDGDSYLVLHINSNGDTEWIKENEEKLSYVAMSERTTRESYGTGFDDKNAITLEDLQLGNIKLGITYNELMKLMDKKPVNEVEDEYEDLKAKTLFYDDDTQIYIVDDTVYSINVTSPDYATPRGLKIGDSTAKLKELYGEPSNIDEEGNWGYTYDGYELFTVVIKKGRVKEIQVDLAM